MWDYCTMTGHSVGIYSMNARGLGNKFKRNQVFLWLKNQAGAIYFIQETHSTDTSEKLWSDEWGDTIYFCHGNSNSRGVCILMNNLDLDIHKQYQDDNGRVLILDTTINGQKFTLANIYGPNDDNPTFFEKIENALCEFDCESVIIGGDFNFVFDVNIDKKGGRKVTKVHAKQIVNSIMDSFDLVDIWREKHPNLQQFTWRSHNPSIQCRLDYFLISFNLFAQIDKCEISPGFKSDHSLIKINIVPTNEARGRGFWKFNTSLLHDPDYVDLINNCIHDTKQNETQMNPSMLWEFMKCQIRSITIQYSSKLSKQRKKQEKEITNNLANFEQKYADNPSDSIMVQINECKSKLDSLYSYRTKGCMIRSRAKEIEFGEKNSRYFINLEKRNQRQKVVTKIETNDGKILTKANDILKEEMSFYSNLYTSCNPPDCTIGDLLPTGTICPSLSDNQSDSCEGLILLQECLIALKSMQNNKSPGTDGFPVEWYKFFFKDIGNIVVESLNYAFSTGKMSPDQRRGIINLIPKKGKDITHLKNWRPITLLNTDYKLATKCIAFRIKKVLYDIINDDQTGFLKGRYIGENIRLVLDIIDHLDANNMPGLMFMIDFEKAFDKLEWPFIFNALKFFNFGKDLINWVHVFYNDTLSCVTNNGNSSTFFNISCGVRQGCPLSPYLFIICAEILNIAIRNDNNIKGIEVMNTTIKTNSFADDTNLFVLDVSSLINAVKLLDKFKIYSGLGVNLDKSGVLPLGSFCANPPDISNTNLKYSQGTIRYLGIFFTPDLKNIFELNFVPKFQKLKDILRVWSSRDLTPLGKITIVKSLGLSQLIFLLSVLPDPPQEFIKELDSVVYKFIWSGRPDKIKRKTLIGNYDDGGLRMCHIPSIVTGLKIAWVKRLLNLDNDGKWKIFYRHHLKPFGGNLLWYCNMNPSEKKIVSIQNHFVRDVVRAWCTVAFELAIDINPCNQIIWNNSLIRIANNTVYNDNWYNNGIKYVSDLIKDNGKFLTYNEFITNYSIENCNFMDYCSIIYSIPMTWKRTITNLGDTERDSENNVQMSLVNKICKASKVCKYIQMICIKKLLKTPIAEDKWANSMNDPDLNWREIYRIPFNSTLSTKLRYFQFQFLHRYLPVNKFLFDIKIIDSNLCSFCNQHTETLQHLFWECTISKLFWSQVQSKIIPSNVIINQRDVFFGILDPTNYRYNFAILHAKYYLYCCRCKSILPNIQHFICKLNFECTTEKQIALNNDKLQMWNRKWNYINL